MNIQEIILKIKAFIGNYYIFISFIFFSIFHELGHFLAARFFGVKVEKFSIGFGKAIYSKY